MPINLGPDAADARQAASLFRVMANPTRLAILLTLQTGLITSRTQGRAIYYRLTQPELGALLHAAGQLLVPARQQATEANDRTVRKTQRTNR